jgi:leader peptidase (prepilin peptidase) / N-methyltransferase
MEIYIFIFVFFIGLCVGSFINVLESRLYSGENVMIGRSKCDHCGKILKWYDLLPVLSWVFYGGKSRCCRRKLSIQYPIVEFMTGVGFVIIFLGLITNYELRITNLNFNNLTLLQYSNLLFYLVLFVLFFTIFIQDLKYQAIHEGLLWFLIIVTFFFNLFLFIFGNNFQFPISNFQIISNFQFLNSNFCRNIIVAFILALPFYVVYKLSKETWLGEGDVWIVFAMGMLLGFPQVFWALYSGIIIGGVVSIIILLLHLKKMRDTISLGPFLILGMLVSLIWFF